jgi:ribose transport system permease protein
MTQLPPTAGASHSAAADAGAHGPNTARRLLMTLTSNWVFLALIVLIAFFSIKAGSIFFDTTNFRNIAQNASGTMLLAVGTAFLIIGGQLDLSIGSVLVFSEVVGAKVTVNLAGTPNSSGAYPHPFLGIAVGILVAIGCGAAWGLLNGVLVTRLKIPSFIVTLGGLGAALGLAQVITKGADITGVPPQMNTDLGSKQVLGLVLPVWIALLVAVIAGLVLAKTGFGRRTYAIGSNAEAARRSGIRVDRHTIILFALMGALAGFAGALDVARFTTTSVSGHSTDNLTAIAAVIIGGASLFGGRGTIFGAVIGVLIPAVMNNGLVIINVQPFWQPVAIGAILIVAVTFDNIKRSQQMRAP